MLKRILAVSTILIILVLIGLKFILSSYVNKNFLVAEIEKSINGRVELGSIDVSLLRPSVKLTLHDVRVAKKDALVTGKVLHDDRPLLADPEVTLKKAHVVVSWKQLLSKKVVVKSILIDELHANMILYKNGENSLETLFINPVKELKKTNSKSGGKPVKQKRLDVKVGQVGETTNKIKSEDYNSSLEKEESILAATLEAFVIRNAQLNVNLESASLKVVAEDMNLKLIEGMNFEFSELTKLSPTKFKTDGSFLFYSRDKKINYGKVDLKGDVFGTFLNQKTGEIQPIVELELELVEGSYLRQIPVLDKLISRFVNITQIPGLKGIVKNNWNQDYKFGKGQTLKVELNDTTYKILDSLKVGVGGWNISLKKGSWFKSTDMEHSFRYHIIANKSSSKLIKRALGEIKKIVPKDYRGDMEKELNNLFTPEGLFYLSFETSGRLNNAKVKELSKIPKLGNFKNQLKDVLKNRLQKELDNGAEEKLKSKISDFFNKL